MTTPINVKCWTIPVESPTGEAGPIAPSEEESARAARYVKDVFAQRYLRARQAARRVLSLETGIGPENLQLITGVDGRPELSGVSPQLHFNISHSGDLILIGLCKEAQIGVDIEFIAPTEKHLVERYFSKPEQEALAMITGEADWLRSFYRCWTRKEAFVKGMGRGLKLPLDKFDVSIEPEPALLASAFADPKDWSMATVDVPETYEAVIAVEAKGRPIQLDLRPAEEAEPTAPFPTSF